MSHRPMVHSEKPIKTRTLDFMHTLALRSQDAKPPTIVRNGPPGKRQPTRKP